MIVNDYRWQSIAIREFELVIIDRNRASDISHLLLVHVVPVSKEI